MASVTRFVASNAETLRDAFRLAPIESALGVVVALTFSLSVGIDDQDTWEWWARLAMAAAVVLPALIACSMAALIGRLDASKRWTLSAVALIAAALYGAFDVDPDRAATAWRWGLLVMTAWSGLLLAPIAARRPACDARAWFWKANFEFAARLTIVMLLSGALYLGLAGALAAIESLFGLNWSGDPYMHLFGAIFFALVPALVLGGLEELLAPLGDEPARVPRGVRWVGGYLLAPLLLVYVAILYAYDVKVLGTGELPKNALSPLALGAAAFGLLGTLLTDPLQTAADRPASVRVFRWFPAYFAPLIPLAVYAVWMRVDQYGWTEFRYVRMLALAGAAAYCVTGIAALVRKRPATPAWIPAIFALLFAIAAVGPLSATAVGKRDQSRRLLHDLSEAGLLDETGALVTTRTLAPGVSVEPGAPDPEDRLDDVEGRALPPHPLASRIYSASTWLESRWGARYVRGLIGLPESDDSVTPVLEDMGILPWYGAPQQDDLRPVELRVEVGTPIPGVPAGTHIAFNTWGDGWAGFGDYEGRVDRRNLLTLRARGDVATECRFDLGALAESGRARVPRGAGDWETVQLDPTRVTVRSGDPACGAVVLEGLGGEVVDWGGPEERFEALRANGRWVR